MFWYMWIATTIGLAVNGYDLMALMLMWLIAALLATWDLVYYELLEWAIH